MTKASFSPDLVLNSFPLIGLITLIIGVVTYLSPADRHIIQGGLSPAIIEQKLAIEEAERSGQKTYQYTTGFTPGLTTITQPNTKEVTNGDAPTPATSP